MSVWEWNRREAMSAAEVAGAPGTGASLVCCRYAAPVPARYAVSRIGGRWHWIAARDLVALDEDTMLCTGDSSIAYHWLERAAHGTASTRAEALAAARAAAGPGASRWPARHVARFLERQEVQGPAFDAIRATLLRSSPDVDVRDFAETCVHEAGHAVIAWRYGLLIGNAIALGRHADREAAGIAGVVHTGVKPNVANLRLLEDSLGRERLSARDIWTFLGRHVQVSAAGPLAEAIVLSWLPRSVSAAPQESVTLFGVALPAAAGGDVESITRVVDLMRANHAHHGGPCTETWARRQIVRTRALLLEAPTWATIVDVAAEMYERGVVSPERVGELARARGLRQTVCRAQRLIVKVARAELELAALIEASKGRA